MEKWMFCPNEYLTQFPVGPKKKLSQFPYQGGGNLRGPFPQSIMLLHQHHHTAYLNHGMMHKQRVLVALSCALYSQEENFSCYGWALICKQHSPKYVSLPLPFVSFAMTRPPQPLHAAAGHLGGAQVGGLPHAATCH